MSYNMRKVPKEGQPDRGMLRETPSSCARQILYDTKTQEQTKEVLCEKLNVREVVVLLN